MMGIGLLKNPAMALLCIGNIFGMLGFYCPFVFIAGKAIKDAGVDGQSAALLLSVIGITNTIGRVVFGWVSDRQWVPALVISNCCLGGCAVFTLLLPFLLSYTALLAYSALFGFFVSAYISLSSIILVDYLGLENLSNGFGLLILARGFGAIIGSPLGGVVYDLTDSYDMCFLYSGGMLLLACVVSCLIHLLPCLQNALPCLTCWDDADEYFDD